MTDSDFAPPPPLTRNPCSLLPVSQLPGTHFGQWHSAPGPGLPENAEDQPNALHCCPVSQPVSAAAPLRRHRSDLVFCSCTFFFSPHSFFSCSSHVSDLLIQTLKQKGKPWGAVFLQFCCFKSLSQSRLDDGDRAEGVGGVGEGSWPEGDLPMLLASASASDGANAYSWRLHNRANDILFRRSLIGRLAFEVV